MLIPSTPCKNHLMRLCLLSVVIIFALVPGLAVADNKYQLYHTKTATELNGQNYETFWRNFRAYSATNQPKPQALELTPVPINEYPTLTPSEQLPAYASYTPEPEAFANVQLSSIQEVSLTKKTDFDGLLSDTKYYLGYQVGMIVLIYFLPTDISKWDKDKKAENLFSKYWTNITNPTWDSDEWYINYLMHPYFGATYYVRARERGYDPMGGFYYSFLMSTLWEFGLEAFSEPVSIQDMVTTPFYGALVGEVFMQVRKKIKRKSPANRTAWNKFVLFMTDPMGSLNNIFRRLTGWTTHLEVEPFYGSPALKNISQTRSGIDYYGYNNYDDNDQGSRNDLTSISSNSDIVGLNIKLTW